jgi:hypothetical protein
VLTGGTSSTSGNAGGAVSLVGGTPGATGVGGAASVTGGIGGSTSGTGGAVTIAGGAGTNGNANGGALTLRGGAKNGSGADGAIAIGDANTASVTFGKMPRIPTATVAATGTNQGTAAAITEGFTLVTAADDTVGVVLPSAVAGMICIVKSSVANKILKVYPNTSDAINALSANGAISLASGPTSPCSSPTTRRPGTRSRCLAVERYTDGPGLPPDAWMDERVRWFEQQVFNVLANQSLVLTGELTPDETEAATIDVLYDADVYRQHKTFWTVATFHFVESSDLTGAHP